MTAAAGRRLIAAAIALLALISTAAYAQQPTIVTPAQTPPGPVLQIVPDTSANKLDVEIGAVRLTTHSGRYTFAYLPLLAPLPVAALRLDEAAQAQLPRLGLFSVGQLLALPRAPLAKRGWTHLTAMLEGYALATQQ